MQHSKIVGGSTAKRVINCPGSVALVQKMPPQVENKYMAEGTALHAAIDHLVNTDDDHPSALIGRTFEGVKITYEHVQEKLLPALRALDDIDPERTMRYVTEVQVGFEGVPVLEGVFGHTDMLGRIGDRAIVLDWKFGDGVIVEAEENPQGLFYAAAALRTPETQWVFEGATEVEIVIVQPPAIRRWVTTPKRVGEFTHELARAVKEAMRPDATLAIGDWCRFCTAKTICPQMNGAIDRAVHTKLESLSAEQLGQALALADKLEPYIAEARKLAQDRLEKNMPVPGYKLVAKRATRQWVDEKAMHLLWLNAGIDPTKYQETKLRSPAQMEKVCKEHGVTFPTNQVVSVSSGNTIAPQDDPRPAVMVLGEQLKAALNRLQ